MTSEATTELTERRLIRPSDGKLVGWTKSDLRVEARVRKDVEEYFRKQCGDIAESARETKKLWSKIQETPEEE